MLNKHEQTDIKTRIKSREITRKRVTPAPAEMGVLKTSTLSIRGKVTAWIFIFRYLYALKFMLLYRNTKKNARLNQTRQYSFICSL